MQKITLRIPDMQCPNCAMHLEGLEDELAGVKCVRASYQKQTMEVEFDETRVTAEQIVSAANALGYHPEPIA